MLQPTSSVAPGGRPDQAIHLPRPSGLTTSNNQGFRHCLHAPQGLAHAWQKTTADGDEAPAETTQRRREMSPSLEAEESLAPAGQPGFTPSGNDPADWLSLINPSGGVEPLRAPEVQVVPALPSPVEVTELVERWVRRVALGGDSRRGVARLDIGEGRYSGAELVVVAEPGRVSVELRLPGSGADSDLAERVRARLERRGYAAEVVVR